MTTKYLKQVPSGHIYIWTPYLAEREDMVPYEQENTRENQPEAQAQEAKADEPVKAVQAEAPKDPELAKALEVFRSTRKAKPKPGGE